MRLNRSLILGTWIICGAILANLGDTKEQTNINYADALGKALLFFEGQRSGKLPVMQRVKWRGNSALSDGKDDNVDLVGGYYDAGDNVKFGWPMAFTTTLLSWTAIEYKKKFEAVKQLEHLRSSIRWGADFILKCHVSPTTLYTQVGDGNADHKCWERPEDMDTPRTLYKITADSPGTEAAAEAAAALASASIAFQSVDAKYSQNLLQHSIDLFKFADEFQGSYSASRPFYRSRSGFKDELLWAAAWLFKASGNQKYLSYCLTNQGWSQQVNEFSWDNKFAGVQTVLAKEFLRGYEELSKFKSDADSFACSVLPDSGSTQIRTTPGGLLFIRDGSNLQYVLTATMVLSMYSKFINQAHVDGVHCKSKVFSPSQIKSFVKSQVDYVLGKNPMKMSYMVGFGSKYPLQLHHRASSIPSITTNAEKVGCSDGQTKYYNSNSPNPNVLVGAIAGGPDSKDQFRDARTNYTQSEPTTYINAAFVGSVALVA